MPSDDPRYLWSPDPQGLRVKRSWLGEAAAIDADLLAAARDLGPDITVAEGYAIGGPGPAGEERDPGYTREDLDKARARLSRRLSGLYCDRCGGHGWLAIEAGVDVSCPDCEGTGHGPGYEERPL